MKRLIACIAILLMVSLASGTATSVTIYGTNKSNAQTNVTCHGCNNTISVQAWNTTYVKNISVNSLNASGDVVSFNISNITAYQVQELKVNGTSVNGYQAGANGMLNFSYNVTGNRTLVLSPALKVNGYNSTWGYFWNLTASRLNDSDNPSYFIDPAATGIAAFIAGDVGIGTSPETKFHVLDNIANYAGYIRNNHASGNGLYLIADNIPLNIGDTGGKTNLYIINDKVAINHTNPTTELDVNGIIRGNGSSLTNLNASNLTGLSKSGTYTGDSTANRAIEHGLGKIPTKILIQNTGQGYGFMLDYRHGSVVNMGTGIQTVTIMDATNFYVGNAGSYINSANLDTNVYNWMAVS